MMPRLKRTGINLLSASLALAVGGCVIDIADVSLDGEGESDGVEARASFTRVLPARERHRITLVGTNGQVTIQGHPGSDNVVIHALRRARAKTRREAEIAVSHIQVVVVVEGRTIRVETEHPPGSSGRHYGVDYEISIPAAWAVEVENANGAVSVQGVDGDLGVESGNGDVMLTDLSGSTRVRLGNGEIRAQITLPNGGEAVYAVGNGGVRLTLAKTVSAELLARVGNGSIRASGLDFTRWVSGPGFAEGTLGAGQGLLDLAVGNGWIHLEGT